MFLPHVTPLDTGDIATIANCYIGCVVHEVRYLLAVTFVGRGEVYGCKLSAIITGCVELEVIVPTLPILAKLSYSSSHLMSVGTNKLAYLEHRRVHIANICLFDESMIKYDQHVG